MNDVKSSSDAGDVGKTLDPVEFAARLIRCPSVTPADAGALDVLEDALKRMGFRTHRLRFQEPGTDAVENLYAQIGDRAPNFCFAGHTDVVPVGDSDAWSLDPFGGEVREGFLWGRGAADMKGAVAAFTSAVGRFLDQRGPDFGGSISFLITGDEEGPAVNGTRKVLEWLRDNEEVLDDCLVGEPTNPNELGEMVKIGRRGSLQGRLIVSGEQGHTAYPHLADNPVHRIVEMASSLLEHPLDEGNEHFQPSTLAFSTIDVGNPAGNVIPGRAEAAFNIRFNNLHSGESLTAWLHERLQAVGGDYELEIRVSGESFLTKPGPLSDIVCAAVEAEIGRRPELSTTGGTSDARFIKGLLSGRGVRSGWSDHAQAR